MNDRVNGVDPYSLSKYHLTTVEQLFSLADAVAVLSDDMLDMVDAVSDGKASFSDAITMWFVELYNAGRINIRQLNYGLYTFNLIHPQVQIAFYETVFETTYPHSMEGLV